MNRSIFTIILILTVQVSFSCSCSPSTIIEVFNASKVVFIGKVFRIEKVSQFETLNDESKQFVLDSLSESQLSRSDKWINRVTISVTSELKGDIPDTVTIFTYISSASCGYNFKENNSYLVYGQSKGLFIPEHSNIRRKLNSPEHCYWSNLCLRNSDRPYIELNELKKQGLID